MRANLLPASWDHTGATVGFVSVGEEAVRCVMHALLSDAASDP